MTTPTGTISMTDIQTEFGGTDPISLSEYYAGGAYVPAGTAGVPSSGAISMDNLRGKSKAVPVTVTVTPSSQAENNWFTVSFSAPQILYYTLYWKITDLTNLQLADFDTTSGIVYYDTEFSQYPTAIFRPIIDSAYEGPGTFRVTVYSDDLMTQQVGQSGLLTVTDTYSTSAPTLSRSSIYRYANLNTGYMASVVYMNTSGLEGATVYYEVYTTTAGQTLTSNDIDNPGTLTGTLTVPTGGQVQLVVRATEWNPGVYIPVDKDIVVRFRLQNSSGALLGTSPTITLYRSPNVSYSASPTSIREGYSTTITAYMDSIPITTPASASVFYTIEGSTATLVGDFLGYTSNSGEFPYTSNTMYAALTAKIDGTTEGNETLKITIRKNSTTGTAFWIIGDNPPSNPVITIESPAQIVVASATDTTVQIDNVSAYPESRTFSVLWRVRPSGTSTYGAWNTPITGQSLIAGAYSMTAPAIGYTTNPADNNGTYDYELQLSGFGYDNYTISRMGVSQTIPVHGLSTRIAGSNANGAARQIYLTVTSTPTFPVDRVYKVQFNLRAWDSTAWGAWQDLAYPAGVVMYITVPANTTASAEKLIYACTTSSAQFDLKFRLSLAGHELKESNELLDIWLG